MKLRVKEIFETVQGEGSQAGRPSVFVRLTGCNLWSGLEASRSSGRGGCAQWCDTDFVGGDAMEPVEVVERVLSLTDGWGHPHVTITGGEPGLQLSRRCGERLVSGLLSVGVGVAVETNGTIACDVLCTRGLMHVTCSPKVLAGDPADLSHLRLARCDDLNIVVPQWSPPMLPRLLRRLRWGQLYFQPLDEAGDPLMHLPEALAMARAFGGSVSLQTHKMTGMP